MSMGYFTAELKVTGKSKPQSLMIVFILANRADFDEMLLSSAFHLGLQCLTKHPFRCFLFTKGLMNSTKTSFDTPFFVHRQFIMDRCK